MRHPNLRIFTMFKSKKYIFVFILFLLHIPSNFIGQPLFHSGNMSMRNQNEATASTQIANKDRIMNEKDLSNVNVVINIRWRLFTSTNYNITSKSTINICFGHFNEAFIALDLIKRAT